MVEAFEGFPAHEAGIEPGDMIKTVNGKDVYGMNPDIVRSLIVGPTGTTVSVEIDSPRLSKPTTVELTRRDIKVASVVAKELDDKTMYIKVRAFKEPEETAAEFFDALVGASRGDRLIIDLRNNGGGAVNTVVDMVGDFIGPDKVVMIEKKRDGRAHPYKTENTGTTPVAYPKKVVILVNNDSASASEIMAGSLQYYGVATIIGVRTFGKARVQQYLDLEKSDHVMDENTRLLMGITTGRYFLPGGEDGKGDKIGKDITNVGVEPDIEVEQPDGFRGYEYGTLRDAQLQAAIEFLKKN